MTLSVMMLCNFLPFVDVISDGTTLGVVNYCSIYLILVVAQFIHEWREVVCCPWLPIEEQDVPVRSHLTLGDTGQTGVKHLFVICLLIRVTWVTMEPNELRIKCCKQCIGYTVPNTMNGGQ